MKVGDLVAVGMTGDAKPVVGIVTEICLPEEHRNGMHLIQVLKDDGLRWHPVGCVDVIGEQYNGMDV